jgi:electron transfer flavoprotein beta subunit
VKILVCIKEVPDTEAVPEIDHQKKTVTYDRRRWSFRINSPDEYALEEALILKESIPGTTVDVVTAGTEETAPALRRALEMGADRGFILSRDRGGKIPASYAIAAFAEDKGYDLILTGVMSDDNMGFYTGPSIAACLNFPWATSATGMSVDIPQKTVTAEREIDSSTLEIVTLKLPALITVQSGINRPRYPSLSNKLKAKSMEIPLIHTNSPDLKICGTETVSLNFPESKKNKLELKGSTGEKAAALYSILRSSGGI